MWDILLPDYKMPGNCPDLIKTLELILKFNKPEVNRFYTNQIIETLDELEKYISIRGNYPDQKDRIIINTLAKARQYRQTISELQQKLKF
jgi:hypothetical protein